MHEQEYISACLFIRCELVLHKVGDDKGQEEGTAKFEGRQRERKISAFVSLALSVRTQAMLLIIIIIIIIIIIKININGGWCRLHTIRYFK
jgi:hypothetical protein